MILSVAFAQATGAAPSAPANPLMPNLMSIPMYVAFALLMYLLLIRPQQQQKKQAEKMLSALKKGDRVLTTGGIFGTVIGLDDHRAVLKIADDTKVEFAKSAIVQVVSEEAKA